MVIPLNWNVEKKPLLYTIYHHASDAVEDNLITKRPKCCNCIYICWSNHDYQTESLVTTTFICYLKIPPNASCQDQMSLWMYTLLTDIYRVHKNRCDCSWEYYLSAKFNNHFYRGNTAFHNGLGPSHVVECERPQKLNKKH